MARLPVLQAVGLRPNHHRIDPATGHPADMSPFEFAAGSYHLEFGRDPPISDESERQMQDATFRHRCRVPAAGTEPVCPDQ